MKKSLFATAMFLVISSKQILACDYYEDVSVLNKILDTGIYKSNVSGKCSNDKKSFISIRMVRQKYCLLISKEDKKTIIGILEVNLKNDIREGLYKYYYKSGALQEEGIFKNDKAESLFKEYYESGQIKKRSKL